MEFIIFDVIFKTVIYAMVGILGTFFSLKRIALFFFSIILFEIEVILDLNEYKVLWIVVILVLRHTGKQLISLRKEEDIEEKGYEID